jgi:hypothetical protein
MATRASFFDMVGSQLPRHFADTKMSTGEHCNEVIFDPHFDLYRRFLLLPKRAPIYPTDDAPCAFFQQLFETPTRDEGIAQLASLRY